MLTETLLRQHNQSFCRVILIRHVFLQVMHHLMLPVIPTEQYVGLISSECPKCGMDRVVSQLSLIDWTDCCCSENQPRLLHWVNTSAILVSRVYQCPNQNHVLGHHPDILHCFTMHNLQILIPFHLCWGWNQNIYQGFCQFFWALYKERRRVAIFHIIMNGFLSCTIFVFLFSTSKVLVSLGCKPSCYPY